MKIYYLPIEPYEERYTKQLDNWVKEVFDRRGVDYETIYGEALTNVVVDGPVLDATGRPHYCMTQVIKILEKMRKGEIKSGDKIFTTDIWIFGLESIPYAATLKKMDIDFYGFNCAGTFEQYDFLNLTGMTPWGQHIERGWFKWAKKVFFAAKTLRNMALEANMLEPKKAVLTGLASNTVDVMNTIGIKSQEEVLRHPKKNKVIFPHRWDAEKRPDIFMDIAEMVKEERPDIEFIYSTSRPDFRGSFDLERAKKLQEKGILTIYAGISKAEYYKILLDCKVVFSSALQDTVGNAMLESITFGCTPVASDRVSYHEYLPEAFLYDLENREEAKDKVIQYIDRPINCYEYITKYDKSLDNMLTEILKD